MISEVGIAQLGLGVTYRGRGGDSELSPDGNYLAFKRGGDTFNHDTDIWVRDMRTGAEMDVLFDVDIGF